MLVTAARADVEPTRPCGSQRFHRNPRLRIRQESLHLGETLEEIDEPLGVGFRDGSHFCQRRPDWPELILAEMSSVNGGMERLGDRQHGGAASMRSWRAGRVSMATPFLRHSGKR